MRVVCIGYCIYTLSLAVALTVLSKSQVYGLMLISLCTSSVYVLIEWYKKKMLFFGMERLVTSGFIVTIVISIFFSLSSIAVLVYYNNFDIEAIKLKNLII